jgi:hypothetical protein
VARLLPPEDPTGSAQRRPDRDVEIQGNVVRDLANLNRIETLPWDNWGLIPTHYDRLSPPTGLLDGVAAARPVVRGAGSRGLRE